LSATWSFALTGQHRQACLEDNAQRPLILIGNGSGIAGLRGQPSAVCWQGQRRTDDLYDATRVHRLYYREEIEG
jgi:sulfite reductase (NADPH) flavoprotein alpha-component